MSAPQDELHKTDTIRLIRYLAGALVKGLAPEQSVLAALDTPLGNTDTKPDAKNGQLEELKLELGVRMDEYKAVQTFINSILTASYQVTNLTLIGLGFLVSGTALILEKELPIVYAVAAGLFCCLAWTQMRYIRVVNQLRDYIIGGIAPATRDLVRHASTNADRPFETLLHWEPVSARRPVLWKRLLFLPLEGIGVGMPIVASIISLAAYATCTWSIQRHLLVRTDWAVIGVVTCMILYTVLVALLVLFEIVGPANTNSDQHTNDSAGSSQA